MERKRRQLYKRNKKRIHIAAAVLSVTAAFAAVCGIVYFMRGSGRETPEELLVRYMEQIGQHNYEEMYRMTDPAHSAYTDKEAFIKRNSAIYEGIEIENVRVEVLENDRNNSREQDSVAYQMSFDTLAGNLRFENEMQFTDTEDGYKIIWHDGLIFPELASEDKVRIESSPAERGKILDRNERMLAGPGTASSVGLVPGRLEDRENALHQLSRLLDMDPETIRNCLDAAWVTEDSFVPLKTVPKVSELDLMALDPKEDVLAEKARQDVLLAIPGVMISDVEVRTYPFGAAAGHLTGYVRNVTAEDLEEHAGEGYNENSVIGKSGLEALFEKELKGQDGCSIYIERYRKGGWQQKICTGQSPGEKRAGRPADHRHAAPGSFVSAVPGRSRLLRCDGSLLGRGTGTGQYTLL
ncbi:NTF2-like N-terminal transpeptidase domain-containing protein [Schaedlerella arabinosiphila]|uniref:NTF2-like N-terminal transpeptidase domain-containing protein n=1 Tax=Schaedlerella arabinosiphila TaxID=2044587 RepID=UPI002F4008D7